MAKSSPQSQAAAIDAPIDGWDAYSSLDAMPPSAAIVLDNWIPGAGSCSTRKGNILYCDLGTGLPVETIAGLQDAALSKLIAASDGGVWDITDGLAITPIAATGTYQNDRWQTENFRKATENGILIMCNGQDVAQIYNGASLTDISTAGTDVALSLTADFIGCLSFKGRVYYWKDNDNAFYFTQAGSYQGVFKKFDLGSFARGGKLVFAMSWTQQDAGLGSDDFLVFVLSTGEVLIYQGDDPESAGYFEQIGRYQTAEPLSIRGYCNYGSDAIIMTKDGYVALSTIVQQGRVSDVSAFSRLIHNAINNRTKGSISSFGWDVVNYQKDGLMIFNVPVDYITYEQHVMNTVTQKWCRFKGWDTPCMKVHNEALYAGTLDGNVVSLLVSASDRGEPIQFTALTAFNYMGDPGTKKHLTAAQVLSTMARPGEIQIQGYADYEVPDIVPILIPSSYVSSSWAINPPSPPSVEGSYWDQDYWSSEGAYITTKGWQNVSAYGYAVALLIRMAKVNESIIWRSTGLRFHMTGAQ
jgi:hypothetical protein